MSEEERQLSSKIHFFEDKLLRSKDYREVEKIRCELTKMRKRLSKMRLNRIKNES